MRRAGMNRRTFLVRAAGAGAVAGAGTLWTPWAPTARAITIRPAGAAASPGGTTLESVVSRPEGTGYTRLVEAPGWPTVVRSELAPAESGREDRRVALAAIVHLTDIHLIDAQSPGRVEFLDPFGEPFTAAYRSQETLTVHVAASMVQRINGLPGGPITGRPFDCAVSTGDNIDNQQTNEADWFLAVLDGGRIIPNSGDLEVYEGVQDAVDVVADYWHPEPGVVDRWKSEFGYPDRPGLLAAAIGEVESPGLTVPWYSTYGNHDGLVQGVIPSTAALEQVFVGRHKMNALPTGVGAVAFIGGVALTAPDALQGQFESGTFPNRVVTADESRAVITPESWIRAHLDSPDRPGPSGHGYTEDHLELPELYYEFPISPGVVGISLDTGGYYSGSLGEHQMQWLEDRLSRVHSRSFDPSGTEVTSEVDDQLVVLFSHFNHASMESAIPNPDRPDERRVLGPEFVAFVHRWPNVIAWVNGHHHVNAVNPMMDPSGNTVGFWDINTASHVDHPQHARLVELADNRDGTLSIFCTMIDHAAPATADPDDHTLLGLASLSRELSANDPQADLAARLGRAEDRNVELVIDAPFDLRAAGITGEQAVAPPTTHDGSARSDGGDDEEGLPLVVGGVVAGLAVAGAAGAVALRRRGGGPPAGGAPGGAGDRDGEPGPSGCVKPPPGSGDLSGGRHTP